jgi:hypothetical protein
MRTLLIFALASFATGTLVVARARTQTVPPAVVRLTPSERALVEGSRAAIIKSGITERYFDEHFRMLRVIDQPGDRRVVWRLSVGGYEATVNDSVGFYTEGVRRVDTHSVAGAFPSTSDITRTITRRRAELLLRRCLGSYTNPQVEYRGHTAGGMAALLLTGQRVVEPRRDRGREARERREREEEREERERRERARNAGTGTRQMDEAEEEEDEGERPVILTGAVDLVTGRCSIGRAQATP